MTREIIPMLLAFGTGATMYALSVKKEQPSTSSMTFSIIGSALGLLALGSAFRGMTPIGAIKTSQKLANTINSALNSGCPDCRR